MTQKNVDSQPLYRQEQQLARLGLTISRQSCPSWMIRGAEWLALLYDRMREHLRKQDILHADETRCRCCTSPARRPRPSRTCGLYRTANGSTDRARRVPADAKRGPSRQFLSGFTGYLHVDGYAGYHQVPGVTLVGCWTHARRKFDEALKALPAGASNTETAAHEGPAFCNKLLAIERELKDASPEQCLAVRLERSKPVVEADLAWLRKQRSRTLPKNLLGQAIAYSLSPWDKLAAFLQDGRLELDNNRSERSIKPFVIGRKNGLFANTPRGAKASATIDRVIETTKENGLNPFE